MKIFAKEINGKVWGLFINCQSAKEKDYKGFGENYFDECFSKTGLSINNYKTSGIGWDTNGHYRFENIWRVLTLRFRGFKVYKSISIKIANEICKPIYFT
tara:strand:+ start:323 stop:622 length:300 start_codon:yes stop_codon:yes gene_type:complete